MNWSIEEALLSFKAGSNMLSIDAADQMGFAAVPAVVKGFGNRSFNSTSRQQLRGLELTFDLKDMAHEFQVVAERHVYTDTAEMAGNY